MGASGNGCHVQEAPGIRKMRKPAPQHSSCQGISKGRGRRDSGKWESRRPSSHLVKAFQRAGGRRDSGKWESRRPSSHLVKAFQRAEGAGIQRNGKAGAPALILSRHFKGQEAPGFRKVRKPAPQDPGKRSSWRCFSIAIFRCKKRDPFSKSKGITLVQYMKCFINSAHGYS